MAQIEQRGKNTYRIIVSCGYNTDGKRITERKTVKLPETMTTRQQEKEIKRQAILFEEQIQSGQYLSGEKTTLAAFIDIWMKDYAEKHLAPLTLSKYRERIRTRIIPALGHLKLAKIQPHHLLQFYDNLGEEGMSLNTTYIPNAKLMDALARVRAKDIELSRKTLINLKAGKCVKASTVERVLAYLGGREQDYFEKQTKSLSSKTIKLHHDQLSSILKTAVQWNALLYSPADRIQPPKVIKKAMRYYDEEQTARLLTLLDDVPLKWKAVVFLAVDTGMRVSEICGMTWDDIDFDNACIHINRQRQYVHGIGEVVKDPKTFSGIRRVTITAPMIAILRDYRRFQNENRLMLANQWTQSEYIMVHDDGKPIHPQAPYKWFVGFLRKNDLPLIPFHALRHTNASLLIANGLDIVTLSGRLGHADKNVTLSTYSHIIQSREKLAANAMQQFYETHLGQNPNTRVAPK